MSELNFDKYEEAKPHRKKVLLWRMVNCYLLPYCGHSNRRQLMRLFGCRIENFCSIFSTLKIHAPWLLTIGHHVCIGPRVELYNKARIVIGNNVVISQDSYLCTASHDISSPTMELVTKPITVCDNVWIAAKATILPGVTIGEGAVVGACAVVAKDVPPWSVVVGNPARVVGKRELREV